MFNIRLTLTGDTFVRKTSDMFTIALTPPAIFGASPPRGNYADLETRGWELQLSWRDQFQIGNRALNYNIGLSLARSEEHTSELQSRGHLVCRLLLEKKKQKKRQ